MSNNPCFIRVDPWLLSALFTASLFLILATIATAKPNVVFLFADDQRADTIGALGNPHIKTPNLDQLVRSGFVFRNAYCLGSNVPRGLHAQPQHAALRPHVPPLAGTAGAAGDGQFPDRR